MTDAEIAALGVAGWFYRESFGGSYEASVAAEHRIHLRAFTPAGVSRGHRVQASVRGDSTLWLTSDDHDFSGLMAMFEALRCELNRDAWLGLTRFDTQLAHYSGDGEAYVRHRDAFEGAHGRRVTAIAYLNRGWKQSDGGELRLHGDPPLDLAPLLGRLIVFMSARVEHEVLPTRVSRLAATAWYSSD